MVNFCIGGEKSPPIRLILSIKKVIISIRKKNEDRL